MAKAPPRAELRELMIVAAEELLATEGLKALQARAIAAKVGCAVGSLYNVFGDIDELILEANSRTLIILGRWLSEASAKVAGQGAEAQLLALSYGYLDFATVHLKRWKAVFEHVLPESKSVPAWYRQGQGPLLSRIGDALPEWMTADGRALMAQTLFSAAHGIVSLALDRKLVDEFDRARTERQLALLVEGAVRSLSSGKAQRSANP
jgi:AcrR family transcriptional regulator